MLFALCKNKIVLFYYFMQNLHNSKIVRIFAPFFRKTMTYKHLYISLLAVFCLAWLPAKADEVQLTNLPTVYITTVTGEEPYDKEHELRSCVVIIDGNKRLTDSALVRLRGNASKDFPKKPYHIRFDYKHNVLGSPASAKRWTLINNYGDKTLMRNLLAFDLSRRLDMPYTPFGTPVDVVVNGDYKGCYQLCDQIQVHPGRVEVDEDGFLIEADAYAYSEDLWFYSDNWTPVSIHYPKSETLTWAQQNTIEQIFNDLEQDSHPNLDRETFLRHFLVGEISGNTDTYWSTYFYKRSDNDLVYTGPVWDFDLAYENDNRTYPICSHDDYVYTFGSYAGDMQNFVNTIVKTSAGQQQLEALYAQYRNNGRLSAEALISVVDSLETLLQASAKKNFQRWPILNKKVHQNPRAGGTYAKEVRWVREYITDRMAWMDMKLNYTPQGIEQITNDKSQRTNKSLLNGQVVIRRGDALYTVLGERIK